MAGQDSSMTTLGTESEQGSPLRRRLKRFDIVLFLACGIVNLDTLGAVSAHGGQGFVWLAILGLIFVIPYGMVVAELGTAFPQEGGHYVWVREAWGKLVAAVTAVFYWIANPIWLGGTLTITAVAVFEEFFIPLPGIAHYIFGGLFISLVIGAACASIDVGKWVMAAGAWLKIVLLSFFSVSVIIYAIQNGVQGWDGETSRQLPSALSRSCRYLSTTTSGSTLPTRPAVRCATRSETFRAPSRRRRS
jgi:amino acid transporter